MMTQRLRAVAARARHVLPRPRAVPEQTGPALPDREHFHDTYFADEAVDLSTFGSFLAAKFPPSGPLPWLDRPDALEQVDRLERDEVITRAQAALCRQFATDGFVVLPGMMDEYTVDRTWQAWVDAAAAGRITPSPERSGPDDPHPGHVMNAHLAVPELYDLFADRDLLDVVELLLGREPIPFQTLMFPKGRGQLEHSDEIHMTTYPLGYMCAAWIALEDIHPDSGPLMYYPGSHRLPRVFSNDVGITPEEFAAKLYALVAERYEPAIAEVVRAQRLQMRTFLPRKGDVLLWHSNLIHGGRPRADVRHSRRSLVCHYFASGAFCYHDLSGKPAERVGADAPAPRRSAPALAGR